MVQMREGAWYRRRDGKIVGPAVQDGDDMAEWPWRVGGEDYTDTGNYYRAIDTRNEDLIEEVSAPGAALSTTSAPMPGFPGDLRDWFAGIALTEAMKDYEAHKRRSHVVAEIAFKVADAMMAQRNKEKAE